MYNTSTAILKKLLYSCLQAGYNKFEKIDIRKRAMTDYHIIL